jgi:prolyl-tRNA editing enzyme YbaK/EbsC (Cys-tRNA(Pro) deacylase)
MAGQSERMRDDAMTDGDPAPGMGSLAPVPAVDHADLLAEPVSRFLADWEHGRAVWVAEIDPTLADTAAFCRRYEVGLDVLANCVVVEGRRGDESRLVGCVVLATTRADVNGVVRRRLDARKASFASMDLAVSRTGMEFGGITPLGLPTGWPLLVDTAVVATPWVVVGSGVRRSKLVLPGLALAAVPGAEVVDGLARSVTPPEA